MGNWFLKADYIMIQHFTQPRYTGRKSLLRPATRGGEACFAGGLTFTLFTSP